MIKVWFLMTLMSYPHLPAISYKGFGGYLEKEKCEEARVIAENQIANFEIKRGNTVYIVSYCMEFDSFESSFSKEDKEKIIENDA